MIPQPSQPKKDDKKAAKSTPEKKSTAPGARTRSPSPNQLYTTSFVSTPRPQSAARDFEEQGKLSDGVAAEGKSTDAGKKPTSGAPTRESVACAPVEETPAVPAPSAPVLPDTTLQPPTKSEEPPRTATTTMPTTTGDPDPAPRAGPSRQASESRLVGASAAAWAVAASATSQGAGAGVGAGARSPRSPLRAGQGVGQSPRGSSSTTWSCTTTIVPASPRVPLSDNDVDVDLLLPAGADAASLMKSTFLQSGAAPLEYPSRHAYVPTPGLPQQNQGIPPRQSPTWCLSCPPNSLGFSAAWAVKKDVPEPMPDSRDYIGFATLPEQVHRKSVKRGFDFTLLVVGESGLGKSTLVNSLFLGDLYKDRRVPDVGERLEKTTQIEKKSMDIEERGVKLRLTIVDTPGFGDGINCEESWRACVNYVDDQFRQYFTDESGLNRRNIQDNRVHCCLYFIPPYGHGLRQIDLEFMRRLHRKVNIVPVIAKADTLTEGEVVKLKRQILADIEEHKIQIYQFPDCDSDEDDEFKAQDRELKACVPFAVVGSNTVLEVGGKKVRGRQYPWGVVEVENPKHSDFNKLRNMLITTHMQDLKDVTEDVHYENFRAQCISQISQQAIRERAPGKLKRDSGVSDSVISEADRLLMQKDEEIRRMQDMLAQMQEQLKKSGNNRDSVVNV